MSQENKISLREVTQKSLRSILRLKVAPHQENFVAPNAVSIAEAYFEPNAWFRAVYADEIPVGFVMTYEDREKPFYYLWRFMIDADQQGNGYGAEALKLVIEHLQGQPHATEMKLSVVPEEGSAIPFYEKHGFVDTGEEDDGEKIFVLKFDSSG